MEARNAIVGLETSGGTVVCTGTFVHERFVVTASHCTAGEPLSARLSVDDIPATSIGARHHPELDVMIVEFEAAQLPADAPRTPFGLWPGAIGSEWIGARVTVAGRGRNERGSSGALLFTEVSVIDVTATEIWVSGAGKSGSCGGDSGGPLLVHDAAGQSRILGTLDRGSSDCMGVDVYTRVDVFSRWMLEEGLTPSAPRGTCP